MIVFLSVFLECLAAIFQIGLLVTAGAGLEKMVRVGRYRAGLCRWSWLRAPCRTLPAEGRGRPARAITRDLEQERKKKNSTSTISLEKKNETPPKQNRESSTRTDERPSPSFPTTSSSLLCPLSASQEPRTRRGSCGSCYSTWASRSRPAPSSGRSLPGSSFRNLHVLFLLLETESKTGRACVKSWPPRRLSATWRTCRWCSSRRSARARRRGARCCAGFRILLRALPLRALRSLRGRSARLRQRST